LNISNPQAPTFQPGVASFVPSAPSFQPGNYQQYSQYGGGYNQQQQQFGGGNYQYGYAQPGQQSYQQYGYQQQYPQYGYNAQQPLQQQQYSQNQQPSKAPVTIAKRPTEGQSQPSAPTATQPKTTSSDSQAPKAKVLSIGLDSAPKVEKAGQTKVLSIGSTAPPASKIESKSDDKKPADSGAKVAAAKAIEKAGEGVPAAKAGKTSPAPSSGKDSPSRVESKPATKEADAVAKEQAADVDESILNEVYGKVHHTRNISCYLQLIKDRNTSMLFS
jgi:peptide chain release factor subunit 3